MYVSINQIADDFDLGCITPPQCRNLKNSLEAFVADYCATKNTLPDISALDKKCLTYTSFEELLQALIDKVCTTTTGGEGTGSTTIDITNLNLCSSDNWEVGDDPCLTLLDACGNPILTYTLKEILQIIIRRIISLENIITVQAQTIQTLQSDISAIKARLDLIEMNCCNVTLVSQIANMNTRLTIAETDIDTIQSTCC